MWAIHAARPAEEGRSTPAPSRVPWAAAQLSSMAEKRIVGTLSSREEQVMSGTQTASRHQGVLFCAPGQANGRQDCSKHWPMYAGHRPCPFWVRVPTLALGLGSTARSSTCEAGEDLSFCCMLQVRVQGSLASSSIKGHACSSTFEWPELPLAAELHVRSTGLQI